jgi:hypothetical protein
VSRFARVLSSAGHPQLVQEEIDKWLATACQNGQVDFDIKYYYLGNGKADPERISKGQFLGEADADQRLPGYYGIEAIDPRSENKETAELWAAIFRDGQNALTEFRKEAREGGDFGYISEEYRILDGKKNADLKRMEAELTKIRADLKIYQDALTQEQREHLATRRALAAAELMEEEALLRWDEEHNRCLDLEAREAEFAPGVEALLSGLVDKAAPIFESIFPHVVVQDGKFVPNPGMMGGPQQGQDRQQQQHQQGDQGGQEQGSEAPQETQETGAIPTAEETIEIFAHLFYSAEGGKSFVDGARGPKFPCPGWPYPKSPWSYIRVLVWMASGEDPGPVPSWPSDAKDEGDPSSDDGSEEDSDASDDASAEGGAS